MTAEVWDASTSLARAGGWGGNWMFGLWYCGWTKGRVITRARVWVVLGSLRDVGRRK